MEDPKPLEKKDPAKPEGETLKTAAASYLSVGFWADYFDVTETEIFDRVLTTLNPQRMNLGEAVKAKPELYGPFWISSTLIFCLFAFGNLSSFLVGGTYNYEYISSGASVMYGWAHQLPRHRSPAHLLRPQVPERGGTLLPGGLTSSSPSSATPSSPSSPPPSSPLRPFPVSSGSFSSARAPFPSSSSPKTSRSCLTRAKEFENNKAAGNLVMLICAAIQFMLAVTLKMKYYSAF